MKKIILISGFLFLSILGIAQNIGDISRTSNGFTKVFDSHNHIISTGYTGTSKDNLSFSSSIIVLRGNGGQTIVYDENLKRVSSGYTGNTNDSFNVVGSNIVVKNNKGFKVIYDKNLKTISSGY
jgi:hypothetical protein